MSSQIKVLKKRAKISIIDWIWGFFKKLGEYIAIFTLFCASSLIFTGILPIEEAIKVGIAGIIAIPTGIISVLI